MNISARAKKGHWQARNTSTGQFFGDDLSKLSQRYFDTNLGRPVLKAPTVSQPSWEIYELIDSKSCQDVGCLFAVVLDKTDQKVLLMLESEEGDYSQRWFSSEIFDKSPEVDGEYHLRIQKVGSQFSFHLDPVVVPTAAEIEANQLVLRARVSGL